MFDAMGPVKRLALLPAVLLLAIPASALGAETTVDAASGATCAQGGVCKTIGAAVGVSQAGDTLKVKAGTYSEDVTVPVALTNLVVAGEAGAVVSGSLAVDAPGVKVSRLTLARTAGSSVAALTATGGTFELRDSIVVSTTGPAVSVTGGAGNLVQRSTIAAPAASADAIRLASSNAGPKALTVDSSILVGGAGGAAARVVTTGVAGDAALTLNHVTAVSQGGLVLDGSGALSTLLPPGPAGSITANVNSSIVHGVSSARANGLPVAGNSVNATYTNSDADLIAPAAGVTVTKDATPRNKDGDLFGKNLRLKPGSPAIDKGGPLAAGESDTDVDGEPRTNGAATDIGADEFVNAKPSVKFTAEPNPVRAGQTVTFTARATDPNGDGDVTTYGFDFGDGSKPQVAGSASAAHSYAKEGTYKVQVAALDRGGAVSELATLTITVSDGTPPLVKITSPASNSKVRLNRKGKAPRKLRIAGLGSDVSGLEKIELAITKRTGGCAQYTGSRFVKAGCTKYRWIKARLTGNGFTLSTRKGLRFKTGTYEVRARGTDKKGNATVVFSKQNDLVRFIVR